MGTDVFLERAIYTAASSMVAFKIIFDQMTSSRVAAFGLCIIDYYINMLKRYWLYNTLWSNESGNQLTTDK